MGPQQLAMEGPNEPEFVDELQPGTQLLNGQYTISRFLNSGGFGITYVARNSLNREVVIKECFPGTFCRRSNAIVAARSRAHQSEFRSIVRLFVQEAHNLAKLVHPNIVGVHQVFEDNDTAYMVIDYIHGSDLLDLIESASGKLTPPAIVSMTRKLLNAVAFIHENGILHRDISPDNILIDHTGEPILIDFGAAREEASRRSRALSALRVVKDGYSPQELYIAGSEQGPWSDLYALGASIYHTISGEAPTNSQARLAAMVEGREDPHLPLAGRFANYPPGFLEAIDMAMNSIPRKRVQSARDWLAMLDQRPIQTNTENIDSLVTAMVAADLANKEEDAVKAKEPPVVVAKPPVPPKRMLPANDWSVLLDPPPAQANPEQFEGPETEPSVVDHADEPQAEKIRAVRPIISEAINTQPRRRIAPENDWVARIEQRKANSEQIDSLVTAMVAADQASADEDGAAAASTASATAELPFAFAANSRARALLGTATSLAVALGAIFYMNLGGFGDWASQAQVAAIAPVSTPVSLLDQAVWDIDIPFTLKTGMTDGHLVASVTGLRKDVDLTRYGNWLVDGVEILSVNGERITDGQGFAASMLKGFKEAPDGMTRAAVQIKGPYLVADKSAELALPAVRRIGLFGALTLESRLVDGKWVTRVKGVKGGPASNFQVGDIVTGEATRQTQFTTATAIEDSMKALSAQGTKRFVFDVLRDGKAMQVTVDTAGQG